MDLTVKQREALNALLDKYERSKTCEGTNQVMQTFAISPADIFEEYNSDFAEIEQIKDFEADMQYLENQGLLTIRRADGEIKKMAACNKRISEFYDILQRKSKKEIAQEQIDFYEAWSKEKNTLISSYCREQIERISAGRKADYMQDVAEKVLCLLRYLLNNREEILERELSMIVLADSKEFEIRYRSKICKILCRYIDFKDILEGIDNDREREKVILEEFNVYANPSYIYIKGKADILLKNGERLKTGEAPLALSSEFIREIAAIAIKGRRIVTVENLTSFHRVDGQEDTYIYLAGYHNTEKQLFLKRLAEENPDKEWRHFGDIDPDGFYILEHLVKGTGIPITPLFMGIEQLEIYGKYLKPLNENDLVKAKNLVQKGCYIHTLQYMLAHNCKLEQEIISLSCSRSNPFTGKSGENNCC